MLHLMCEGGNSELKSTKWRIPVGLRKYLKKILDNYTGDKTMPGYDRLNNLLEMDVITYQEMKRLKNYFDTYGGTEESQEYQLNGGSPMKNWVNRKLSDATDSVRKRKEHLRDTGVSNAFRSSHINQKRVSKSNGAKKNLPLDDDLTKKMRDTKVLQMESKRCIIITENQKNALFINNNKEIKNK